MKSNASSDLKNEATHSMKNLLIVCMLLITITVSGQTEGNLEISVRTVENGANFSPRHVFAAWIEDNVGNFVKTLELNAAARKQYLYTWNSASSGNTVDAVTGSTLTSISITMPPVPCRRRCFRQW